jgi:hypothetical protein
MATLAYGLVRDKNGRPKIDDPSTMPVEIIAMLTDAEKQEFGLEQHIKPKGE